MNSEKLYDQVYTFDDQDQATIGEQELSFDKYKEWGDKVLGAMKAEQGNANEDQTTRWEELNIDHTGRSASAEQPNSVEQEPATPESTAEKVKKKSAFKKIKAIAAALALTAALAGCTGGNDAESKPADAPATGIEDVERPSYDGNREKQTYESLTGSELLDEMIDGSFEQYDNPGGHDRTYAKNPDLKREGRPDIYSATSVANVADILQFMAENGLVEDTSDVKPEEWGMAYKFVTFSQKEPAAYVAIGAQVPGFENLSYDEAVAKIDAMSASEKELFQQDLQDVFGRTTFTEDQVEGTVESFYIGDKNGEKKGYVDAINLEKPTGTIVMNIGSETLYTDDHYVMTDDGEMVLASALATESKEDDGQTTKLTILKRCFNGGKHVTFVENGKGEITVIVIPAKPEEKTPPTDTSKPDTGKPDTGKPAGGDPDKGKPAGGDPNADIPQDSTTPDDGKKPDGEKQPDDNKQPEDTPASAIPEAKDPELEIKNAPEGITPLTINNVVTPPTTEKQDQENFEAIRRQQEEAERRQQEAERRQQEQAEAERRAAEEAEQRRREAEAAEQRRLAELEEQKRQADEAERKRLEEAERRRQQEEADARARADAAARQAEAEAQARQEAAAAAERARQQEEAARQKAQEEANRLAEQQKAEAERNASTQSVGQNADIFNNGDF